jgi:uncharacterized protein (TIGR03437 family)
MHRKLAAIAILGMINGAIAWAQPPGGPGGGPGGPGGASGDGIWTRNAAFGEAETFDLCNGHQPGTGMYHHHINPVCLRAQLSDNVNVIATGRLGTQYAENATAWTHSPILGWSFDGYPVYGPYGYSNPMDPASAIKRVQSSFQLRSITVRQTLPTWVLPYEPSVSQNLTSVQYGPPVSATYPLGRYVQDYDYIAGLGDLDQYNGRFTVTPDFPSGTYAYFVTLASDGTPAFPYIINVQLYGTPGSSNVTVASDAVDYFENGALTQSASTDPRLASWRTKGSAQDAEVISGFDPSAGPSTTWPTNVPSGVTVSGGQSTPALADTQRIRYDANAVYVNSNNLPSYTIGPWFEATMTGGVFMNWASSLSQLAEITRNPTVPATKSASGMGPVGMWVNGAAIFNVLDGASYSNTATVDEGGGGISPRATNISAASLERGPLAAGSLVSAYAEFNATLAGSTATGSPTGAAWPLTLGGATVTVTDSTGAQLPAGMLYASPTQVNYQVPSTAAAGPGKVTITSSGTSVSGTINILPTYPGLFKAGADALAAGQTVTVIGSTQTGGSFTATTPINVSTGEVYLILYGTGIGAATVTATIGGVNATVAYSGPQGTYPGLDQVNLLIPPSLAGKGKVNVVVTANNKPSNPVYIVIQ